MGKRKRRPDYILLVTVILLVTLGMVLIYSISPVLSHKLAGDMPDNYFITSQMRHLAIGLIALAAAAALPWWRWRQLVVPLTIVTAVALLLLFIPQLAITRGGATRWIGVGGFSFQPVELLKLAVVIGGAHYLSRLSAAQLRERKRLLWPALGLLGVLSLLVVFAQRDLGTMLVLAAIIIGLLLVAGVRWRDLGIIGASGLGVGVASILLFPHRMARLLTFINPGADPASSGYHLHHALIAVGSGGLFGVGLGKSIQVFGYLPEAASDSIFAILAETFGFAGSFGVILLFSVLVWRMLRIASAAPDRFSQLIVIGTVVWLATQALVNIAAMTGLVPLTGIPLPFLSYGGSSLVLALVAVGIVINISKHAERKAYAHSTRGRRHGRSYYAASGHRPSHQAAK